MKIRLILMMILLSLVLTACFRDAGNGSANPTRVDVADIFPTATETRSPATLAPTFTPNAGASNTPLPPVGGPPVGDDDDSGATPTLFIPTFTQVPDSEATIAPPGFGDTGISTTPIPSATDPLATLQATPTQVNEDRDDCIYVVQSGDTLYSIAEDYSLTQENDIFAEDFIAINPELAVNPNSLYLGQELKIPDCIPEGEEGVTGTPVATTVGGTAVPSGNPNLPPGYQIYIIEQGDTLFSIAFSFGVTVQDIVDATDFLITENTIIHAGDELVIPPPAE